MILAYDKNYLEKSRTALARMFDFAVNDLGYSISDFYKMFLSSDISGKFENGNIQTLVGSSGVELAYEIIGDNERKIKPTYPLDRSKEYWLGWALCYVQWATSLSFSDLTSFVPIEEMLDMYNPFHEMDIQHFLNSIIKKYNSRKKETNLKRRRKELGLSQSQLSKLSNIPLRTIQQYEQKQKNINNAKAECILSLSKVLYCKSEYLLEINIEEEDDK